MKKKILIICTGNSCRSQMAEGILKSIDPNLDVFSAGVSPAIQVAPKVIIVLKEIGLDISQNEPKNIDIFLNESFDYVITVCDHANETCPIFTGKVKNRIHIGFEDPVEATGTDEEILAVYRRIRDEINEKFVNFYLEHLWKK